MSSDIELASELDQERAANTTRPMVSVIIPAVNEENTIRDAIEPLLNDPAGDIEVIVAVGPSRDRTRETVLAFAADDDRVKLVDNHATITPAGLNAAIVVSQGQVILRMDGHALPDPGYVRACLEVLRTSSAWNVGGRIRKKGATPAARAAAAATSSPFGIGAGRRFHLISEPEDVDTLWPGCWPRWVFERIGLFDPEMVQNQDDEFNQRIVEAGGTIRFDPSISATYLTRSSWRSLFRQYFRYGTYKVRGIQKHPSMLRPRHLVPAVLVTITAGCLLLSPWVAEAWIVLAAGALIWLTAATIFAGRVARDHGATLPGVVFAFACLHVGYGLGTWFGVGRFWRRWFVDRSGIVPQLEPAVD